MKILKISYLFILIVFISGCSSVPKNTSNSCSIFDERYLWYKHAKKTEKKWGTPIYLQLAIIKMESSFNRFAKPPRQKLFKVVQIVSNFLIPTSFDLFKTSSRLLKSGS